MAIKISVIIPAYREEEVINTTIQRLKEMENDSPVEIIVVDGDSSGSTINCIEDKNNSIIKLTAPKGRAVQMNKGAATASGDILLFLHADTILPKKGLEKIKVVMKTGKYVAGAFNYAVESRNPFLKFIYYTSYLRSRVSHIAYGDQAIFIRKDYFEKIGRYPEIPIMEDVELMKRIKKNKDRICILKDGVNTSTRRYEMEGIIHGWLRNHKMRILYFFGVSPKRLIKYYPDVRKKMNQTNKCALVFFLKFPQKGNIKTRLAKAIGNTLTLKLYQCFILDLLDKLISLQEKSKCDLYISLTPANNIPAMHQWLKQHKDLPIPIHPQEGHDLGERMKNAFEKMFQMGYQYCALMGTDFPDLPISIPLEAVEQLKQKNTQAVIAPTADGGYYLIGFQNSHFCEAVFNSDEIQWSTNQVFQQTMRIFQQKGVQVKQLQQWRDVDDIDDLEDLMKRNINNDFKKSRTMQLLLEHKKEIF